MRRLVRGWTLHEMIISLSVMAIVAALASHAAVAQLRFFDGVGEITSVRGQASEVGAIVAAVLAHVSPPDGDVLVALDSALEVRVATGVAVVCDAVIGRVSIAAPRERGVTLAALPEPPRAGDVAAVAAADSAGGSFQVTLDADPVGTACQAFDGIPGLSLSLREPLLVPVGSVIRFTRPVRLNTYRASDARWYFGVRDWNQAERRLNTVQPVAGPLAAFDRTAPGLRFRYFDSAGLELTPPFDHAALARVSVTVRAESKRPVRTPVLRGDPTFMDSVTTGIAIRNAT